MTVTEEFVVGGLVMVVTNVAAIASAWGSLKRGQKAMADDQLLLRADVESVKRVLGLSNGDGIFVRRTEMTARIDAAEQEHQRLEETGRDLWSAVNELRARK